MGEVPTKPNRKGDVEVRNALEDTLRAEPSLEPEAASPPTPLAPLAFSDRYRLGGELGRGGMGRVVEAFDLQLGRTVALKEVLPKGGPSIIKRFMREVQLTARLEHPSIVPLYDSGTTADGRPYYCMRRVSGRPLDQLMAQAVDLGERLTLLPALLAAIDAVGHAHRRGVIHRDLKPANILVGELGETVVIDWGLAKVIGEDDDHPGELIAQASDSLRTQIGSVFGTPGFMAPEQARGEALDPRGDVYALGAILYQLLAGAPPHSGTSATEVIANTGTRQVTPVNVVAPGAPADLVAIVGKALAFEAGGRYVDAAELAEDVRRFLAGQLVAAHHYTRRQHIARFARRHRAPLSVAALAMVAVAVLAWIGVHRIVHERDVADEAREQATRSRLIAEGQRDELQRRADQLTVSEARGLIGTNPTAAAAVLKSIPASSDRLAEARAVAQSAVVHGTAWAMQLPDGLTVYAELSVDAKFLLQVGREGEVRVWDLDRRRLVVEKKYARSARATWAGKRVFVSSRAGAELLDPFAGSFAGSVAGSPTGAAQVLALGPITWAVATASGDRIAYLDAQQGAHLYDVARREAQPVWPGHKVSVLEIADDGSWIAASDAAGVVVLDAAGHELTSHPGQALRIVGSRFGSLAVQDHAVPGQIFACTLAPRPVWTALDYAKFAPGLPIDVEFRGRELDAYISTGKVVAWNGQRMTERMTMTGFTFRMSEAAGGLLVVPGIDGQLHVASDLVTGALHLPVPLQYLKVYARPSAPRVIALGQGQLVGFDLGDSLPELLHPPGGVRATFVDDDTLLLWDIGGGTWSWYDVRSRVATPFEYRPHGMIEILAVDSSDGRVLVRETAADSSLFLLRKNTREQRPLVHGARTWGRMLPHDAMVFGVGDGRVFGVGETIHAGDPGAAVPREVVKLDGAAESAVGFGDSGYAAVSTTGELVRGDLATNALTRGHVAPGTTGVIAADHAGHVLLAEDGHLLRWDHDVVELAALDQRILRIAPLDHGALLELADHAVVHTTLVAGAPIEPVLPASDQSPMISADGHLIIGQAVNNQLTVVELTEPPAGPVRHVQWSLPAYYASIEMQSISPSTRRFVQAGYGQLALWTLPLASGELRAWLDERTNAAIDLNQAIAWPWQLPPPGPAHPVASAVRAPDP